MRYRAFLLTLTVVAVLLALFYLPRCSDLRRVNILADVQHRESADVIIDSADVAINTPATASTDTVGDATSTAAQQYVDSIPVGMTAIEDFATEGRAMDAFYAALSHADQRLVRVAYFGDSFIEGDILVGDLRHLLQQRYGGRGVGWVDMSSVTESFRQTITHNTRNWAAHYAKDHRTFNAELQGISGAYFIPNGEAYTSIRCQTRVYGDELGYADNATLYYMPSERLHITLVANDSIEHQVFDGRNDIVGQSTPSEDIALDDNHSTDSLSLTDNDSTTTQRPTNTLQPRTYTVQGPVRRIEVRASGQGRLFGVTMDGSHGIAVDNLSMRGSQGWHIANIPTATLAWFAQQRPYDLIVVHFGLNVASKGVTDYKYYTRRMVNSLRALRQAYPRASILLVSTSDIDVRDDDGNLQTMDGVKALVQYQRRMASDEGIAFWNLYEAMGGELSVSRLTERRMANRDYTHINSAGGRELANIFYEVLMNGRENYERRTANH